MVKLRLAFHLSSRCGTIATEDVALGLILPEKAINYCPPRLGEEPASLVAKNVFTAWEIAADALPRHFSEVISLRSSLFDM